MLITDIPLLDELLQSHVDALGKDYTAYRHHDYRVINFCAALSADDAQSIEKMAIAAAFHDLGVWTEGTLDYLDPSERHAQAYLVQIGKTEWGAEIGSMIQAHHKITGYRSDPIGLVEAFRKADLVDVSWGLVRFGVPRAFIREVYAAFPDAGFHKRLVQLTARQLIKNPLRPMPMMRW